VKTFGYNFLGAPFNTPLGPKAGRKTRRLGTNQNPGGLGVKGNGVNWQIWALGGFSSI